MYRSDLSEIICCFPIVAWERYIVMISYALVNTRVDAKVLSLQLFNSRPPVMDK